MTKPNSDSKITQFDAALEHIEKLASQGGRDRELISLCTELEADFGDRFELFFHRGQAQFVRGELNDALRDMSRAISLAPNEPAAAFFRGLWSLDAGLFAQARDDLHRAISLEAVLGTSYYVASARLARAIALVREGSFEEALAETAAISREVKLFAMGRLWSVDEVNRHARSQRGGRR